MCAPQSDAIGQDAPRWLGAWWLGFILTGATTALVVPLRTLCPQRLPVTDVVTDGARLDIMRNKLG